MSVLTNPLVILAIAVAIVLISILKFRLHAFLALTFAALVVAMLTPQRAAERFLIEKNGIEFSHPANSAQSTVLHIGSKQGASVGMRYLIMRPDPVTGKMKEVGTLEIISIVENGKDAPRAKVVGVGDAPVTPLADDTVIHVLVLKDARAKARQTIGEKVAGAFGSTCTKIGILIALAAIIGKCLLDSGAADKIVRSALRVVGERGAPVAFVGSGFLLGIPVFFDTVFYLMMPLGKAMRMRTGRNYLLYILCIVAGGSMAHSLVPPTPGPLLVAGELGIDLGLMIVAGCLVGMCSSTAAFLYAMFVNHRAEVPLRESADFSLADLEKLAQRDEKTLPPLWISVLPIVLPVILIAGNSVLKQLNVMSSGGTLEYVMSTLGNKNIALAIASIIAIGLMVWQRRESLSKLAEPLQGALASGGIIILITAAGGAFGGMLQQTGVVSMIRDLPQLSTPVVLTMAFFVTTAIRTAQGSATVAMITAVGILSGFASPGQMDCHPVYLALAIGCGSKPIAWMNDSGFWVICKMSGMTEAEGLRFVTPMSILMGLVGLAATLLGATVLPMV
jgi:GntP family gluconate:H+ symporter